uniref:Uncharacterized protein n=1 Tax=Rhizophora mucronata TaxID=61149 RepID=A0A2P2QQL3_RHIMU
MIQLKILICKSSYSLILISMAFDLILYLLVSMEVGQPHSATKPTKYSFLKSCSLWFYMDLHFAGMLHTQKVTNIIGLPKKHQFHHI